MDVFRGNVTAAVRKPVPDLDADGGKIHEETVDAAREVALYLGRQVAMRGGSVPDLRSSGKNSFSARNVQTCTAIPASWAAATVSGVASDLAMPMASAYLAIPAISPISCSSNCTSGKRVMPRNCFKLFGSNDWMNTGEPGAS